MVVPRPFLLTKAYGLLALFLLCLYIKVSVSLVVDLRKGHYMLPNSSDLNPSQSAGSKAKNNKPCVCTPEPSWVGTGFLKESCDSALLKMYLTEVARYNNRMLEFSALGAVPPVPPLSMRTPRKYTVGECRYMPSTKYDTYR